MALLRDRGYLAEKEGAVWFAASQLGEDKDNVLIRSNGKPTYFASDIAYHYDKFFVRNFDRVVEVWGADHQGHVAAIRSRSRRPGHRARGAGHHHPPARDPDPRRRHRAAVQAHGRDHHPARGGGRGGARRLPLLLPGPRRRLPHGLRPGAGQAPERREPRLLRPVRPRPHRRHPDVRRRAGRGLRGRRRVALDAPGRDGAHPQDAAAAGAGGERRPHAGASPPAPLRAWSWPPSSTTSTRSAAWSPTTSR